MPSKQLISFLVFTAITLGSSRYCRADFVSAGDFLIQSSGDVSDIAPKTDSNFALVAMDFQTYGGGGYSFPSVSDGVGSPLFDAGVALKAGNLFIAGAKLIDAGNAFDGLRLSTESNFSLIASDFVTIGGGFTFPGLPTEVATLLTQAGSFLQSNNLALAGQKLVEAGQRVNAYTVAVDSNFQLVNSEFITLSGFGTSFLQLGSVSGNGLLLAGNELMAIAVPEPSSIAFFTITFGAMTLRRAQTKRCTPINRSCVS